MKEKMRVAICTSTPGGSTAQAIMWACASGQLPRTKVVLLIASNSKAGGLRWAQDAGVPTQVIRSRGKDPEAFGEAIIRACEIKGVDLIGQYGWLAQTPANVIEMFQGPSGVRMVNQHGAPLDPGRADFGGKGMFGLRAHCARLLFVRRTKRSFWTTATAQRVHSDYDKGDVLHTEYMDILPNDDPYSLAQRLLPVEHRVQIETLEGLATGRIGGGVTRAAPLVRPEEVRILREAKLTARVLFPRG